MCSHIALFGQRHVRLLPHIFMVPYMSYFFPRPPYIHIFSIRVLYISDMFAIDVLYFLRDVLWFPIGVTCFFLYVLLISYESLVFPFMCPHFPCIFCPLPCIFLKHVLHVSRSVMFFLYMFCVFSTSPYILPNYQIFLILSFEEGSLWARVSHLGNYMNHIRTLRNYTGTSRNVTGIYWNFCRNDKTNTGKSRIGYNTCNLYLKLYDHIGHHREIYIYIYKYTKMHRSC